MVADETEKFWYGFLVVPYSYLSLGAAACFILMTTVKSSELELSSKKLAVELGMPSWHGTGILNRHSA